MTENFCPFCHLDSSLITINSDLFTLIEDKYPVSPGHILIISKRHICSFFEMTLEEQNDFLKCLEVAKLHIGEKLKPDGYNIGINDGEAAGQTINHLHIHLIPRYKGDSQDPRGGVRWIFPDKAPYWESNE